MKSLLVLILIASVTSQSLTDRVEINDIINEWMLKLDFRINSNYSDNNALEEYYLRKWDTFAVWRFPDVRYFADLVWINEIIQATNLQGSIYNLYRSRGLSWSPPFIEFKDDIAVATYKLLTHSAESPSGGSSSVYISNDFVNCILIKEEDMWKMIEVVFHCSFKYHLAYGIFPKCAT